MTRRAWRKTSAARALPSIQIARLLSETGAHAEAERYARQALEIDIRDKEAREVLFKALGDQKKENEIERLKKALE